MKMTQILQQVSIQFFISETKNFGLFVFIINSINYGLMNCVYMCFERGKLDNKNMVLELMN